MELIAEFKAVGCEINEHEFGYRSIHYLVRSQPAKQEYIAEIQVRTIFEEGWSEIDHQIRYPYDIENSILGQFLVMFNRLAGSADEMGSFVKLLKRELYERESAAAAAIEEKNTLISNLQEQIAQLKVAKQEKDKLKRSVEEIQRSIVSPILTDFGRSAATLFPDLAEWKPVLASGAVFGTTEYEITGDGVLRIKPHTGAESSRIEPANQSPSTQDE